MQRKNKCNSIGFFPSVTVSEEVLSLFLICYGFLPGELKYFFSNSPSFHLFTWASLVFPKENISGYCNGHRCVMDMKVPASSGWFGHHQTTQSEHRGNQILVFMSCLLKCSDRLLEWVWLKCRTVYSFFFHNHLIPQKTDRLFMSMWFWLFIVLWLSSYSF